MKKSAFYRIILVLLLLAAPLGAYAWDHSVEIGYGVSHDPNDTHYTNSGFLLSGDIYPFYRSAYTFWSLNGGLGQWRTTAPDNKNVTTAALGLALRYYAFNVAEETPAYLLLSAGPAYLSHKGYGVNQQGSNWAFQVFGGFGVEFDEIDVNFRMVHYSNAYLAHPNNGYNILYMLSVGYLF